MGIRIIIVNNECILNQEVYIAKYCVNLRRREKLDVIYDSIQYISRVLAKFTIIKYIYRSGRRLISLMARGVISEHGPADIRAAPVLHLSYTDEAGHRPGWVRLLRKLRARGVFRWQLMSLLLPVGAVLSVSSPEPTAT